MPIADIILSLADRAASIAPAVVSSTSEGRFLRPVFSNAAPGPHWTSGVYVRSFHCPVPR